MTRRKWNVLNDRRHSSLLDGQKVGRDEKNLRVSRRSRTGDSKTLLIQSIIIITPRTVLSKTYQQWDCWEIQWKRRRYRKKDKKKRRRNETYQIPDYCVRACQQVWQAVSKKHKQGLVVLDTTILSKCTPTREILGGPSRQRKAWGSNRFRWTQLLTWECSSHTKGILHGIENIFTSMSFKCLTISSRSLPKMTSLF